MGEPAHDGEVFSQRPAKTRPRVLVVDGESLVRWSLSEMLAAAGYQVVEAQNGHEARVALADEQHPIDVMLVDLNLPDTDGLVLVRQARGRCLTCPVLVMTTDGFAETLDGALRAGAHHVMVKPFDLDDLARVMLQVCPAG